MMFGCCWSCATDETSGFTEPEVLPQATRLEARRAETPRDRPTRANRVEVVEFFMFLDFRYQRKEGRKKAAGLLEAAAEAWSPHMGPGQGLSLEGCLELGCDESSCHECILDQPAQIDEGVDLSGELHEGGVVALLE